MPHLPEITWQALALGLAWLAGAIVLAGLVRWAMRRYLLWRGRSPSAARIFSQVTWWLVTMLGFFAMLVIVFPSVKPVNILGGVGVVSIAAGIAFQTVLGNMFAGLVLLARDSYRVDDQIAVGEVRGTVTQITLSSTRVRTFDGRMVLIPNSIVHSSVVIVQTGYEQVRSSVDIDIDDSEDLDRARELAIDTMLRVPEVIKTAPPEAFYRIVGQDLATLELRFWSGSLQLETRAAQDAVIRAVIAAFHEAGIRTAANKVRLVEGMVMIPDEVDDPA